MFCFLMLCVDVEETGAEKPSEGGEKSGGAEENGGDEGGEQGGEEEEEGKDGGEGQEDLSLAQKLEKQGDSAPDHTDSGK